MALSIVEGRSRSTLSEPADKVLPAASGKALIRAESFQLIGAQVTRFAMKQRQVGKLGNPGKTDCPLHSLFDTVADHRVAMGAHQDR